MGLDKTCRDRSYVFGRIFAVYHFIDEYMHEDGKNRVISVNMETMCMEHPMMAMHQIDLKMNLTKQQLIEKNPELYEKCRKLICECTEFLEVTDPELNNRVGELYPMGLAQQGYELDNIEDGQKQ